MSANQFVTIIVSLNAECKTILLANPIQPMRGLLSAAIQETGGVVLEPGTVVKATAVGVAASEGYCRCSRARWDMKPKHGKPCDDVFAARMPPFEAVRRRPPTMAGDPA